jgi:hypothetical protein
LLDMPPSDMLLMTILWFKTSFLVTSVLFVVIRTRGNPKPSIHADVRNTPFGPGA